MTLIKELRMAQWEPLCEEAADRIEALETQLERQGQLVDWYQAEHPQQVRRIEDLEAALEKIIEYESGSDFHPVVRIARAALKDVKNDKTV
jgi:hypothetical protein